MNEHTVMLDMGTGGGEFLLSLPPPGGRTYATEAYLPNYELCSDKLTLSGIDVKLIEDDNDLPFESGMFDLVINRHEAFAVEEVCRIFQWIIVSNSFASCTKLESGWICCKPGASLFYFSA
ncbi:methyltransferase family protein [Fontibacillus phaseoli]|uniref:Methyltransferase family protein n=1 Tax=Fontibacillus phaseoli TaxID=1416533 RepID=A0A369BEH9_9BACL|nr:methyltransferase domain-containing protein [Fontibacillus phaseoli]RCX18074.1 methyltransferase family protein [Fontibacillus phaseoli]